MNPRFSVARFTEALPCKHEADRRCLAEALRKAAPIIVHRVLDVKQRPGTVHRCSGLRAQLIGRKVELSQLGEAVERLRQGRGMICAICGDAGTGKSRLVEEFKAALNQEEIQWLEGHAYPYSQNIPYFLFIDLLNRAWGIEEGDPPDRVREKVEANLQGLMGRSEDLAPYIGKLYALSYPQVEGVSPESWKSHLFEAARAILAVLANRGPTIVFLEDIHWADPSSLELLRFALEESGHPAIFLCVYRPPFGLLTSHQTAALGESYREIKLQDLSPSETQDMVLSLLGTDEVPTQLKRFIQEKVEGNPFYLEEVMNSLIEVGALASQDGRWRLIRPITDSDIPPTIQGVISARLDRLEREMKRILQEASVIGRAFLYEILKKITELKGEIDRCLGSLERLDLIRTRCFEPHVEYIFKHALTQEAVYKGLLKTERREIHERIAMAMEELFHERLPEFYETLAFHFKQGRSLHKAVDYLVKSGEKSLKRYAVEESHQYFEEAYTLLENKPDKTTEEKELLIDLINKWCLVFYYRGDFRAVLDLLRAHEDTARSTEDKVKLGMFYAWFGMALYSRERFEESHEYLSKALELGEEMQDERVLAYACAWLSWTCGVLGRFDEAVTFGKRGQEMAGRVSADPYPFFKSLGGLGFTYWHRGDRRACLETGQALLDYGRKQANVRSLTLGHWMTGFSHLVDGDFSAAAESSEEGVRVSKDPFYCHTLQLVLGLALALAGRNQEAEEAFREVLTYSRQFGAEIIGTPATVYLGIVLMAKGHLSEGLNMLEETRERCLENHRRGFYAQTEYVLGKVYLQIVEGAKPAGLQAVARNLGFLVRNVPVAGKKAEEYFKKAIDAAEEIGAKGTLGMAYLDLGNLHRTKGRHDKARECISTAIQYFETCNAETFLKQARDALASIR